MAHDRNEAALRLVGRFGALHRCRHAPHQGEHVDRQDAHADHEPEADRQVLLPEGAKHEHHRKTEHGEQQRSQQVARPVAEAVGQRDPDVDQEQRQRMHIGRDHEKACGARVERCTQQPPGA